MQWHKCGSLAQCQPRDGSHCDGLLGWIGSWRVQRTMKVRVNLQDVGGRSLNLQKYIHETTPQQDPRPWRTPRDDSPRISSKGFLPPWQYSWRYHGCCTPLSHFGGIPYSWTNPREGSNTRQVDVAMVWTLWSQIEEIFWLWNCRFKVVKNLPPKFTYGKSKIYLQIISISTP